jgi:hypothetical protein
MLLRQLNRASSLMLMIAVVLGLCGAAAAADSGAAKSKGVVGTWAGTWSGTTSGHLDLTLAKGSGDVYSGSISATPNEGPGYAASLDDVKVEAAAMSASFKIPDGPTVSMKAVLEGGTLKGTYEIRESQNDSVVETGTWTATRS